LQDLLHGHLEGDFDLGFGHDELRMG